MTVEVEWRPAFDLTQSRLNTDHSITSLRALNLIPARIEWLLRNQNAFADICGAVDVSAAKLAERMHCSERYVFMLYAELRTDYRHLAELKRWAGGAFRTDVWLLHIGVWRDALLDQKHLYALVASRWKRAAARVQHALETVFLANRNTPQIWRFAPRYMKQAGLPFDSP